MCVVSTALIAGAATVLAVFVTAFGQWLTSRNDRQLTLAELNLLSKMRPGSQPDRGLEVVIGRRVGRWRSASTYWRRMFRRSALVAGISMFFAVVYAALGVLLKPDTAQEVLRQRGTALRFVFGALAWLTLALAYLGLMLPLIPPRWWKWILHPIKTPREKKNVAGKAAETPQLSAVDVAGTTNAKDTASQPSQSLRDV